MGRDDTLIDEGCQYNIASITMTVVATVVLQLMEEGRLDLDVRASLKLADIEYLRFEDLLLLDGESCSDEITIDKFLQHRAGLADPFTDTGSRFIVGALLHPRRQYSPERVMDTYFDYRLNERPNIKLGEGYFYSDIDYVLLGLIIEQVTGSGFPDQIRHRVLEPLEMDETYFEFYEQEVGSRKRTDAYLGPLNMARYMNTSYEWGGGGLVSTTEDMATFIKALFDLELSEEKAAIDMMIDKSANRADDEIYARSIKHYRFDGETYDGHGGFYGSLLAHDPQEGITLSAHIAQASQPYEAQSLVEAVLEIVEAPRAPERSPANGVVRERIRPR